MYGAPVIVSREQAAELGPVVMVDGGFDPLHAGHIAYFRAAAELGHPVFCSVSPDTWVARKHPPLLAQHERAAVVDAIRYIAYTYAAEEPTAEVLRLVRPAIYAKGDDWRDRLPETEVTLCAELGTEIVFLDTVTHSSSAIVSRFGAMLGSGR
jgi:cytidyltransferase-like protein